jgi:NDP-sugar pyrophosphorylase family protein
MPRGAAGSARDAALATQGQTFVIADGTSIPRVDLNDVLLKHHTSGAAVTVVVNSEEKRNAALDVPSGIYVFSRRALEQVPAHGFCDIKETLIPKLYDAGERIVAYEAASATPRVMDAATYMAVNEWMIERLVTEGEEQIGYSRTANGFIHRDAFIADDASIVGPVLVGPGARIESDAVVIGPTSIGREAIVERGALVSRSAVWRRSIVGEYSTADRCIVADDAIVSAGAAAFKDVIVPDRASTLNIDWVERQTLVAPKTGAIEAGARLGRLVFGGSWSRFPAAQ